MNITIKVIFSGIMLLVTSLTQAREITNPDNAQMNLLYRYLASDPPDFSDIARKSYEVRSANEFNRGNVAKQIENNLRRDFELMKDVDVIRIRARAKLSEYDSGQGGFYLSPFKAGIFYRYGKTNVGFDNADQFHLWKVAVADARNVVEKIGYSRDVVADIRARPFAIDASQGRKIRTQVIGVDIIDLRSGQLFASLSLPESEYRDIKIAGLQTDTVITPDKLNILGLTHETAFNDAIDWAVDNDYWMFSFENEKKEALSKDSGAAVMKALNKENRHTPDPYFSSDKRSFNLVKNTNPAAGPNSVMFAGGWEYSIFGQKLDCNAPDNLGVKCGRIEYKDKWDGNNRQTRVQYISFLQNVAGVTREQVIAKLTEKYGVPSDNISTTIYENYRSNLLVWGRNRQTTDSNRPNYSRLTWSQGWEVEAYIVEPDGQRIAVITHINNFGKDSAATAKGGNGQIKF